MGFEYGCRRRLDPVRTAPEDWHARGAEAADRPHRLPRRGQRAEARHHGAGHRRARLRRVTRAQRPRRGPAAPRRRLDARGRRARRSSLVNPDLGPPDGIDLGPLLDRGRRPDRAFADADAGRAAARLRRRHPDHAGSPGCPPLRRPCRMRPSGRAPAPERDAEAARADAGGQPRRDRAGEPELDGGRFPVKRIVGDVLTVEADIFVDGHDKLAAVHQVPSARIAGVAGGAGCAFVDNDRWAGSFPLTRNTRYLYTVEAWRDQFESWRVEVTKKHDAGVPIGARADRGPPADRAPPPRAAQGDDARALAELLEQARGAPGRSGLAARRHARRGGAGADGARGRAHQPLALRPRARGRGRPHRCRSSPPGSSSSRAR